MASGHFLFLGKVFFSRVGGRAACSLPSPPREGCKRLVDRSKLILFGKESVGLVRRLADMRAALLVFFLLIGCLSGGKLAAADFSPYPRVLSASAFNEPDSEGGPKLLRDFFHRPEFPWIVSPDERVVTVELGGMTAEDAQQLLDSTARENQDAVVIVRLTGEIEISTQPLSLYDKTCLNFEEGGRLVAGSGCTAEALLLIRDRQLVSVRGANDPRIELGELALAHLDGKRRVQAVLLIENSGGIHLDSLSVAGGREDGIRISGRGAELYESPVTLTRSVVAGSQGNGVTVRETAAFIALDSIISSGGKAGLAVDAPSSIIANVLCRGCETGILVSSSGAVLSRNQIVENTTGIMLAASSQLALVYENQIHKNKTGVVIRGTDATVGWNDFGNSREVDGGGKGNVFYSNGGLAAKQVEGPGITLFDPPTAANFHAESTIWKDEGTGSPGKPRVDFKLESGPGGLAVSEVNSRLIQLRQKHPEAVLVVRLVGQFFFADDQPLQIPDFTCIVLDGQIVCDDRAGFSKDGELIELQAAGCVSFSGGKVITKGKIFSVVSGAGAKNVLLLDGVELDLQPDAGGSGESPVNAVSSKKHRGPFVVRNCNVSTLGHRGIWAHVSKRVYALGNSCRAGNFSIDFDAYCFQSAALFNHVTGNERHSGVFFEECVKENIAFANYVEKSKVHGISMWTESVKGMTEKNVVACNSVQGGPGMEEKGSGMAVGGRSEEKTSAHNFFFNNRLSDIRGRAAIFLRQNSKGNYFAENVVRRSEPSVLNWSTKPRSERFDPQTGFHSTR